MTYFDGDISTNRSGALEGETLVYTDGRALAWPSAIRDHALTSLPRRPSFSEQAQASRDLVAYPIWVAELNTGSSCSA